MLLYDLFFFNLRMLPFRALCPNKVTCNYIDILKICCLIHKHNISVQERKNNLLMAFLLSEIPGRRVSALPSYWPGRRPKKPL